MVIFPLALIQRADFAGPLTHRLARRRYGLAVLFAFALLLTGCRMEQRVTMLPDGRWREEFAVVATHDELGSFGGEIGLDLTFQAIAASMESLGATYNWRKSPVSDGVRYESVSEGSDLYWGAEGYFTNQYRLLEADASGAWRLIEQDELPLSFLAAVGGKEALDAQLAGACESIRSVGGECVWSREDSPGFLRYELRASGVGGSVDLLLPMMAPKSDPTGPALDPSRLGTAIPVTPTWRETASPTPGPLPSTATPSPLVDEEEVRGLVNSKRALMPELESLTLGSGIFAVPALSGFQEDEARAALAGFESRLGTGGLAPADVERLRRLVLQEKAASAMWDRYGRTAETVVDPMVDMVKLTWGIIKALQSPLQICDNLVWICPELTQAIEKAAWSIIRDIPRLLTYYSVPGSLDRGGASDVVDGVMRYVEDKLEGGDSLRDILIDKGAQVLALELYTQGYRSQYQALLDKGSRTASIDAVGERWPITGNTQRAEMMLADLATRAGYEADAAVQRHGEFQDAVKWTELVEDVTDFAALPQGAGQLVKLSPVGWISKMVGIGLRLEKMAIAAWELSMNRKALKCVSHLSFSAAETAFDAQRPAEDCYTLADGWEKARAGSAAPAPARFDSTLHRRLGSEADEYRAALNAMLSAVEAGDRSAIKETIRRASGASDALAAVIDEAEAVAGDEPDSARAAFFGRATSHHAHTMEVFLSAAAVLAAREGNEPAAVDLRSAVGAAIASVAELERDAAAVDFTVPQGARLLIAGARAEIAGNRLRVTADVKNVGAAPSRSAQLGLRARQQPLGTPVIVPPVDPNATVQITLLASLVETPAVALTLSEGGEVWDVRVMEMAGWHSSAAAAASSPADFTAPLVLGGIAVVAAGAGGAVYAASRRSRDGARQSGQPAAKALASVKLRRGRASRAETPIRGDLIIGRDRQCGLVLDDLFVTARHARIATQDGSYVIEDLGSKSGTFVGGLRVHRKVLASGDVIQLGATELLFIIHPHRRAKEGD